tara:strand:+ start:4403 stop:5251 length:849 start_codon:yes stop_codon:yes gene_type:complete
MVVIQIFVLVVFLCIAFSVPISIGFLALPNDGMLAILGLLACFVALVLGLGDRMLLFFLKAEPLKKEHFINDILDRYSLLFRQKEKRVYLVEGYSNCYVLKSLFSDSILVLDKRLLESLSNEELEAVLFLTCVKSRGSKVALNFSFQALKSLSFLPLLFLKKGSSLYKATNILLTFILYPLKIMDVLIFRRPTKIIEDDLEVANKSYLGRSLASAIFKISQLNLSKKSKRADILERMIEGLAILEDSRYDALRSVSGPCLLPMSRFKALIDEVDDSKAQKTP